MNTKKEPLEASLQQDGTILLTIRGNLTEENLPLLREDVDKATQFIQQESLRAKRPLPVLVDLTDLNRVYSPEAITLIAKLEKNDEGYVSKTACFGADIQVKFAGEIVTALSSRKNIAFYDTKDEAVEALKEASNKAG